MRKKKKTSIGMGLAQGTAVALASYLLGILMLTAAILQGWVSEYASFSCIAGWCAFSVAIGGVLCRKQLPWGSLPAAAAVGGIFAAIILIAGLCWSGVNWAGEGGGLLASCTGGTLLAAILGRKKSGRRIPRG